MKKIKVSIVLIIFFTLIFTNMNQLAIDVQAAGCGDMEIDENFRYTLSGNELTITRYIGTDKNICIPSEIGSIEVNHIGIDAFKDKGLESVTIPETIKSIGRSAFANNNLTNVDIPNSVTWIAGSAFSNNIIKTLRLGSGLEMIEISSFSKNSISSVTIPSNVTTIGQWAFAENKLTEINIPDTVSNIGEGAFQDNKLTRMSLPNNIQVIPEGLFANNELESIIISDSVRTIGIAAFKGNKLEEVVIPNTVTRLGNASFADNKLNNVTLSKSLTNVAQYVFQNNQLESVIIPDEITEIDKYAFDNNKLINIVFSRNIKWIRDGAFRNNELTSLLFPERIDHISFQAFSNNQLTRVEIPNKDISVIGGNAFFENQSTPADLTLVGYPVPLVYDHARLYGYTFENINESNEEKEMKIIIQPLIEDQKATFFDEDIDNLAPKGTIVINLKGKENVTSIELSKSQMEKLKSLEAMIEIEKDDAKMVFPSEIFNTGNLTIHTKKVEDSDNIVQFKKAIGAVYDFTFSLDKEVIGEFSEDVEIVFPVDPDVKNKEQLFVYYWNEATSDWESIGGIYKDGFISARTNHFSTFAVFNKHDLVVQNEAPVIDASDQTITVGDTFDELAGVTAADAEDGDLTSEITVTKNDVDPSTADVYDVTYEVTDSDGATTTKTIKVTVEADDITTPTEREVTQVEVIPGVTVDKGIAKNDAGLPTEVMIELDNGDLLMVEVIWDEGTPKYNKDEAGRYEFFGKLVLPDGINNPEGIKVRTFVKIDGDPTDLTDPRNPTNTKNPTKPEEPESADPSDDQFSKVTIEPEDDTKNKLPKTATNMYTWILIGLLLIGIAGALMIFRKKSFR